MDGNRPNMSTLLYGCNGEVKQSIPEPEGIFLSFIYILMIFISTFGNILVVLGILKNRKLRFPRNYVLCSLGFIDFLSPIVRLLSIAVSTMKGKWIFGCICCAVSSATGVFFCSASILHLCVITLERYICVRYPLRSKVWVTKNKTIATLVFVWLLALMMALIPYFTSAVDLYFNNQVLFCDFYLVDHPHLSLLMTLLYFCLPVILMVIVYYLIYRKTVMNNQRMSTYHAGTKRHKTVVKRRMKQEWKTVKMVIVVIGMFFVLWLPYFSVQCFKSYHPRLVPGWVQRAALTCAYVNSCCNFIVYSIMNKKLREAFKELMPCIKLMEDKCSSDVFKSVRCMTTRVSNRNICATSGSAGVAGTIDQDGTTFSDLSSGMCSLQKSVSDLDEDQGVLSDNGPSINSCNKKEHAHETDDIVSDQSYEEQNKSDLSVGSPTSSIDIKLGDVS